MALPMMRGCSRVPFTFSLTRLYFNECKVLTRSGKRCLPPPPSACAAVTAVRPYSSDRGGEKQKTNVVFVSIPNPIFWFRSRIYYFLIRAYFDKEFSIKEFTEGATQAFFHVSRLLAKCQFSALEGLVAKDLVGKLEEKCNLLPLSYKKALSADSDEMIYTMPTDVGIYYDDDGRKFVSILMRFWYMTNAQVPDDTVAVVRTFKVTNTGEGKTESKRLLTASYEFQREFTKGVLPEWIITRIEHYKILD